MDRRNVLKSKGSLAFGLLLCLLLLPTAHSASACGWAGDGEARAAAEAEVVVVGRDGKPLSDDERAETPSPVSAAPKTERSSRQTERSQDTERGKRHGTGASVPQGDREEPVKR